MNNATNTAPALQCVHQLSHPRLADLFTNGSSKTSNASPLVNEGELDVGCVVGTLSLKHGDSLAEKIETLGGGKSKFALDHFKLTRNPKFLELEEGLEFPYALWLDSTHFVSCAITRGSLMDYENADQTVSITILYSRFETVKTLCTLNV